MAAQGEALENRLKEWEVKERERAAKMEEFRERMRTEAEEKAEAAALRLEAALTRDVEKIVAKRDAYEVRVRETEVRCVHRSRAALCASTLD